MYTKNESKELKSLRKALSDYSKQVETEGLEILRFTNCEKERRALAKWMLQTGFDVWVQIELRFEYTKELEPVEIRRKHKQILTTALNIMDRVFYGNNSDRKNETGTRFVYGIEGKVE